MSMILLYKTELRTKIFFALQFLCRKDPVCVERESSVAEWPGDGIFSCNQICTVIK